MASVRPSVSTEHPPNIVLITVDQMRGDCMGVVGHPDVKTPYLDALALEGTLFRRGYTATPSCIPARAALMTGQSQTRHGRVGYQDGVTWDYPYAFPQVLSDHGYRTKAVGKMHVHPPRYRCGFQDVTLHDGYLHYYRDANKPHYLHQHVHDDYITWLREREGASADLIDHGIECNSWLARPWPYKEMHHPTNWVISESIDFVKKCDRTEPFFLMASIVRPHPPFDAPQAYFDMYEGKELRPPAMGDWADPEKNLRARLHHSSAYATQDKELQRQGLVGYYACITHIDHQIGRLMEVLKEEGAYQNTLFIFTSDHGEILFDHGMYRKIQGLEGSVNVPYIIAMGPELKARYQEFGTPLEESQQVVELRDIGPTILDFAGASIPTEMDGIPLTQSLFDSKAEVRPYLHGEHSGGELSNHYIVTSKDKYLWYSTTGQERYFDLENDPREEKDLINDPQHQERIKELRGYLITALTGREEGYSDGTQLISGQQAQSILSFLDPYVNRY